MFLRHHLAGICLKNIIFQRQYLELSVKSVARGKVQEPIAFNCSCIWSTCCPPSSQKEKNENKKQRGANGTNWLELSVKLVAIGKVQELIAAAFGPYVQVRPSSQKEKG